MIQAAIFGFGNIGGGVLDVIEKNQEQIRRSLPEGLHIKYILDIRDFPDSPYADRVVHDLDVIINDPEIRVVCETMGGKEPAFTFSKKALEKGISVCSSNKELVEAFGPQLLKTAAENHCNYLFEASVGGGIPLLNPIINSLRQEDITSVTGILNGTTNYILTKMEREGADYAAVLKEAQELGYAEKNPAADVEGHDTGRKIAILSSLMSGKTVKYDETYVEGITGITARDIAYAAKHGHAIKLLGRSSKSAEGMSVMTAPFLIPEDHPLHAVSGVFNGIFVHGNMVDDLMFYGRGAGKLPTGSAVVSDMINAVSKDGNTYPIVWSSEKMPILSHDACENRFFARVSAERMEQAKQAFAGQIEEIWSAEGEDEFAFVTAPMSEKAFADAAADLQVIGRIRVFA